MTGPWDVAKAQFLGHENFPRLPTDSAYFGSVIVSIPAVLDCCTCTIFPSTLALKCVVSVTRPFSAPDAALPTGPKKRVIVAKVLLFGGEVAYRVHCGNVTSGSDTDTGFDEA